MKTAPCTLTLQLGVHLKEFLHLTSEEAVHSELDELIDGLVGFATECEPYLTRTMGRQYRLALGYPLTEHLKSLQAAAINARLPAARNALSLELAVVKDMVARYDEMCKAAIGEQSALFDKEAQRAFLQSTAPAVRSLVVHRTKPFTSRARPLAHISMLVAESHISEICGTLELLDMMLVLSACEFQDTGRPLEEVAKSCFYLLLKSEIKDRADRAVAELKDRAYTRVMGAEGEHSFKHPFLAKLAAKA